MTKATGKPRGRPKGTTGRPKKRRPLAADRDRYKLAHANALMVLGIRPARPGARNAGDAFEIAVLPDSFKFVSHSLRDDGALVWTFEPKPAPVSRKQMRNSNRHGASHDADRLRKKNDRPILDPVEWEWLASMTMAIEHCYRALMAGDDPHQRSFHRRVAIMAAAAVGEADFAQTRLKSDQWWLWGCPL